MSDPDDRSSNAIDWQQPWLAPLLPVAHAAPFAAADWRACLNVLAARNALTNARGLPLRFVAQEALPSGEAYEAFIDRTGGVPTRANLHDYFNALAWLTYPAAKRALNALQAAELARHAAHPAALAQGAGNRGTLRDRATIFDENAAVLLSADPDFEQALRAHDWQRCFVAPRRAGAAAGSAAETAPGTATGTAAGTAAAGASYEVRLFGHALQEKLVAPYKAITAHVWVLPVAPDFFSRDEAEKRRETDALLGAALAGGLLTQAPTHLPVLGVPGWWPQQDAAFYADRSVFREKKVVRQRP